MESINKNSSNELDPEITKIRDQIIKKIGDKPLDEINTIIRKLLDDQMDENTRLGALAARVKIIRLKIETLYENEKVKAKVIKKVKKIESSEIKDVAQKNSKEEEKQTETKDDSWMRIKMLETAEVNGKQIEQGVVLDAKRNEALDLIDANKAKKFEEKVKVEEQKNSGVMSNSESFKGESKDSKEKNDEKVLKPKQEDKKIEVEDIGSKESKEGSSNLDKKEGSDETTSENNSEVSKEKETVIEDNSDNESKDLQRDNQSELEKSKNENKDSIKDKDLNEKEKSVMDSPEAFQDSENNEELTSKKKDLLKLHEEKNEKKES